MRVVVVAVHLPAVPDVALEAVHREVHPGEASGFVGLLDAVDGEFCAGILFVFRDEPGRRDEHAARAARGVQDAPVVGLDDFGEEADDAGRGVELAAFLALGARKLAEEVFVDAAEGVVVHRRRNLGHLLEQFLE